MRRVKRWPALVAVIALAGTIVAGCSGGSSRGKAAYTDRLPLPVDTMTTRMQSIGTYGGRFLAGATASPKTLNPIMSNEQSSTEVCNLLYISLADTWYPTQEDIPGLAKSWDFSDDKRTATFHLRRGACFSDGHPMTSDDVKFSFDVVMSDIHPSMQDGLTMDVGGQRVPYAYSAPDSYTFVVSSPKLDAILVDHVANVRIVPKHVLEPAFLAGEFPSAYGTNTRPESLVTSGPFRLKEIVPEQKTVLERNPYWYGVDAQGHRLPYLDEVVFVVAKDQDVAALKFHAGELDGLDNVKPEDYQAFESEAEKENFTLYDVGTSFNTFFFWFNLNTAKETTKERRKGQPYIEPWKYAWFANPVFRRAMSKAVDRDAIIRGPFYGYAVKNWAVFTPGNATWYDSTITGPDYDPEGAKQLLASIDMKDRNGDGVIEDAQGHDVAFTMITNADNRLRMSAASFLKADLAKVGVKLEPAGVDFNTLVTRTRSDFQYDACMLGLGSAVPSIPAMGGNFYKSSGLTHYWHVKQVTPGTPEERRMDELFERILSTPDPQQVRGLYHDLSQTLNDAAFVIWLPVQRMRIPVKNRFGNVQPSPMPHRILWNADRIFVRQAGAR